MIHLPRHSWARFAAIPLLFFLIAGVSVVQGISSSTEDIRQRVSVPARVLADRLDEPIISPTGLTLGKIDPLLLHDGQSQNVLVRLSAPSLGQMAAGARRGAAPDLTRTAVGAQQTALINKALVLDSRSRVRGQIRNLLNGVILEIDPAVLPALAADPAVLSISKIQDYELYLGETVPYIGATAVQARGYDGAGVTVAVLDSGIDYTHAELGGPGTTAAYTAAYGTGISDPANTRRDGLFPTARVIEGYDFVGEMWPVGVETPDPDPIDYRGHGTHVADIIAGLKGVAPGANLLGVKVCSALTTSCSGIALLQGMDFAVDPNGDGNFSDAADIINLSMGTTYTTAFDDDLSAVVENAAALGILTVAAAGNCGNHPYCTSAPASSPSALSVAETAVPSARINVMAITAPAAIAGDYSAVLQPWSKTPAALLEAPLIFGDGSLGNPTGCNPFTTSLSGRIVMVDRGVCPFSTKVQNIENAGGLAGIISLIDPGEPFAAAYDGGDGDQPQIPAYMIGLNEATLIKIQLQAGQTVRVAFDPALSYAMVGTIIGSSGRGPSLDGNLLKPEIGAPGGSVSAVVGTGRGRAPFSGTSGAAPMAAGAAALLMEAYPARSAAEIKAVLMNTAETGTLSTNVALGGELLPKSRIGSGEVHVDRALASAAAAWDTDSGSAALSFAFQDIARESFTLTKEVRVRNYSSTAKTFDIRVNHRDPAKVAQGEIEILTPAQVTVPANGDATVKIRLQVATPLLQPGGWLLNSGQNATNPGALDAMEFDGDLILTAAGDPNPTTIHLPWHLLPRKAGDIRLKNETLSIDRSFEGVPAGRTTVVNRGQAPTTVSAFSLIGVSGSQPLPQAGSETHLVDLRYVSYRTIHVPAGSGVCGTDPSFLMEFAINNWQRSTLALTDSIFLYLDTNLDGQDDFLLFNYDLLLGNGIDGRNLVWVQNLSTGGATAYFFTGHITNSANYLLTLCGEQIGMTAADYFQPIGVTVRGYDTQHEKFTDQLGGIIISPLGEQYVGLFAPEITTPGDPLGVDALLAPNERIYLYMLNFGRITNNSETGLLVIGNTGSQYDLEAQVILANGN